LVRNINDAEMSIVSVERILEYRDCPQEVIFLIRIFLTYPRIHSCYPKLSILLILVISPFCLSSYPIIFCYLYLSFRIFTKFLYLSHYILTNIFSSDVLLSCSSPLVIPFFSVLVILFFVSMGFLNCHFQCITNS